MSNEESFLNKIKRYLVSGLLLWLPIIATIFIISFIFDIFSKGIRLLPTQYQPEQLIGLTIPGLGFIITIAILLISGALVSNLLGKKLIEFGERILEKIPLIRSIYKAIKQVTHAILGRNEQSFRNVVMIEYPKSGCYSLAFQTSHTITIDKVHPELTTVFVPTTPNPTSGFLLMVPAEGVTDVDIPIEEALRFIISLGVVTPEKFSTSLPNKA